MKTKGIVLIVLGIITMTYAGFNYRTTKNVVAIGSIQISQNENHTVQWTPYAAAVILAGGVIMVGVGKKIRV